MLRIADLPLEAEDVVEFLKQQLAFKGTLKKLICQSIIEKTAREHNVIVTPEEVQQESETFRRQNRLESAALTLAWLKDELISIDDWEKGITQRLLAEKLAEHLFGDDAESHFIQHKLDYDRVSLYKITLASQALAYEVFYQIEEKEISFFEAAHRYDLEEESRLCCGYQGHVSRWNLPPEIAAHIFGVEPNTPIEPLHVKDQYYILMVEEFVSATFTPETRREIINKLFNAWLEREFSYEFQSVDFLTR